MSKKYIIPGVLILAVIILWFIFGSDDTKSAAIYVHPKIGTFAVNVTTAGELRAKNSTEIRGPEGMRQFRVYQVDIQKLVPEGTVVKKGDFVAELDRSDISDKLKDAKLDLKDKQSEFSNAKLDSMLTLSDQRNSLVDLQYALKEAQIAVNQSKYESPAEQRQVKIDLDQAKRAVSQAKKKYKTQKKKSETNLQQIQNDLQKQRRTVSQIQKTMKNFTIHAPENGMVIYRRHGDGSKVTEGSQIQVWDPVVAKLPDFSVMNSITYVNEVDIQKVNIGQPVDIGLDAMPEKNLSGVITDVANIGEQRPNSDSKVFQVTIRVNQSDSTLRPSMTTSNQIEVNKLDSALHVPLETIHSKDSMDVVFKKENQRAVMQQVVLGMMNKNDAVIKAGLSKEDELYLSLPADTADLKIDRLPEDVLQKYRNQKPQDEVAPERKMQKGKFKSKRGNPSRRRSRKNQ